MNLREEIAYQLYDGELPNSTEAIVLKIKVDNIMKEVKKWALEMVENIDFSKYEADLLVNSGRRVAQKLIIKNIEESD